MTTEILALAKFMIFAATLASPPGENPDEIEVPPNVVEENQHFCCGSVGVGPNGKPVGEGCTTIGASNVDACLQVLSCSGDWIKQDGNVACL